MRNQRIISMFALLPVLLFILGCEEKGAIKRVQGSLGMSPGKHVSGTRSVRSLKRTSGVMGGSRGSMAEDSGFFASLSNPLEGVCRKKGAMHARLIQFLGVLKTDSEIKKDKKARVRYTYGSGLGNAKYLNRELFKFNLYRAFDFLIHRATRGFDPYYVNCKLTPGEISFHNGSIRKPVLNLIERYHKINFVFKQKKAVEGERNIRLNVDKFINQVRSGPERGGSYIGKYTLEFEYSVSRNEKFSVPYVDIAFELYRAALAADAYKKGFPMTNFGSSRRRPVKNAARLLDLAVRSHIQLDIFYPNLIPLLSKNRIFKGESINRQRPADLKMAVQDIMQVYSRMMGAMLLKCSPVTAYAGVKLGARNEEYSIWTRKTRGILKDDIKKKKREKASANYENYYSFRTVGKVYLALSQAIALGLDEKLKSGELRKNLLKNIISRYVFIDHRDKFFPRRHTHMGWRVLAGIFSFGITEAVNKAKKGLLWSSEVRGDFKPQAFSRIGALLASVKKLDTYSSWAMPSDPAKRREAVSGLRSSKLRAMIAWAEKNVYSGKEIRKLLRLGRDPRGTNISVLDPRAVVHVRYGSDFKPDTKEFIREFNRNIGNLVDGENQYEVLTRMGLMGSNPIKGITDSHFSGILASIVDGESMSDSDEKWERIENRIRNVLISSYKNPIIKNGKLGKLGRYKYFRQQLERTLLGRGSRLVKILRAEEEKMRYKLFLLQNIVKVIRYFKLYRPVHETRLEADLVSSVGNIYNLSRETFKSEAVPQDETGAISLYKKGYFHRAPYSYLEFAGGTHVPRKRGTHPRVKEILDYVHRSGKCVKNSFMIDLYKLSFAPVFIMMDKVPPFLYNYDTGDGTRQGEVKVSEIQESVKGLYPFIKIKNLTLKGLQRSRFNIFNTSSSRSGRLDTRKAGYLKVIFAGGDPKVQKYRDSLDSGYVLVYDEALLKKINSLWIKR